MNMEDLYRLLRAGHVQAQGMVDTVPDPLLVLDQGLRIQTASRAFFETFKVDRFETIGRPLYELGNGQWDIPELRRLLLEVIPKASAVVDFRVDHDFPDWLVPVPLASRIADDGSFVDVQVAGFGMSRDRVVSSAGKLRERRFDMLDQIDSKSHQLFLIDHKATRRTINNNGICRGDSGGPVFQRQGANYVLVGVISAVMGGKGRDCGTITAVTAVSAYRTFIETMADRAGSPVRFQ